MTIFIINSFTSGISRGLFRHPLQKFFRNGNTGIFCCDHIISDIIPVKDKLPFPGIKLVIQRVQCNPERCFRIKIFGSSMKNYLFIKRRKFYSIFPVFISLTAIYEPGTVPPIGIDNAGKLQKVSAQQILTDKNETFLFCFNKKSKFSENF